MNQNKNLLYLLWSAAIVVCVVLSILALGFSACSKQDGDKEKTKEKGGFTVESAPPETPAPPVEDSPAPAEETPVPAAVPAQPASVRLGETPDAGREYLDKIIFLGDSTTYGIGVYYGYGYTELCPPAQVWTPASGTLTLSYYNIATIVDPATKEELTIEDAVKRYQPEYLVVTLGVNGIAFMDEEWFIRDYTALVQLIQAASPDTKIILNSIYPVADSYKYQKDINNDKIRAANGWIERIAADTGVRYLYSYECLAENGRLPEADQNGDGLHLTGEAFTKVMQYIRTHAYV